MVMNSTTIPLIKELELNCRQTHNELSTKLGITRGTVAKKIKE